MRTRGFTLIELLVVIAIIGLLASIILTALNSARAKARDASRISDIKELEKALELYSADNNGYPTSNGSPNGDVLLSDTVLQSKLVPKYLSKMPAILVSDNDHYYAADLTTGVSSQYGLYVYTEAQGGYCKTGVSTSNMATNNWWGTPPVCAF